MNSAHLCIPGRRGRPDDAVGDEGGLADPDSKSPDTPTAGPFHQDLVKGAVAAPRVLWDGVGPDRGHGQSLHVQGVLPHHHPRAAAPNTGFFCAIFQEWQVVRTSGTLSFRANFVEFFAKREKLWRVLEKLWKKTWVFVKFRLSFGSFLDSKNGLFLFKKVCF